MAKRRRIEANEPVEHQAKKARTGSRLNLLDISDEILLRILSFVSTQDLLQLECVSRRVRALATDHEVWKQKFYETWIRSRGRSRRRGATLFHKPRNRNPSDKTTTWPDPSSKSRNESSFDWKRQYKIKSNWAAGKARVHELEVAQPCSPPVTAKVDLRGHIFTVDTTAGLRAWTRDTGSGSPKSQLHISNANQVTCMAIQSEKSTTSLLIGFDDGTFALYAFDEKNGLRQTYRHPQSNDGPLVAAAVTLPYAITLSKTKFLSLYRLDVEPDCVCKYRVSTVARLQSDASLSPVSLSLRNAPNVVVASIAYAFHRLGSGWCIGLQEIRLAGDSLILDTRLTSTIDAPPGAAHRGRDRWETSSRATSSLPLPLHPRLMSPPTSLSYEHPFLVCSLSDNTIMSFLVSSNEQKLDISSGRRLWGHTSAVSGTEVNNRGKAVSISCRGGEIRVWELEDVMTTASQERPSTEIKAVDSLSQIAATLAEQRVGLGLALREVKRERAFTRRWVGFDDEQVVILGERDKRQIMALYDFT